MNAFIKHNVIPFMISFNMIPFNHRCSEAYIHTIYTNIYIYIYI